MNDPMYFLNVPIPIMNSWITTADGKPLPAITVKAIIFLLYISKGKKEGVYPQQIRVSLEQLCANFGYQHISARSSNYSHHVKRIVSYLEDIAGQPLIFRKLHEQAAFSMLCVESVKSDIRNDKLTVCFSEDFVRYWKKCSKSTLYINLYHLSALRSTPTVILYFLLMSLPPDPDPLSKKDMAKRLTGNPDYPYKLLKKDMILPALKQINELTGWSLHLTEYRNGNRVAEICFLPQGASMGSANNNETLEENGDDWVSSSEIQPFLSRND